MPGMSRADSCMWRCPVRTIDTPAADGLRIGGVGRTPRLPAWSGEINNDPVNTRCDGHSWCRSGDRGPNGNHARG
jgi:hypothetical protein